MRATDILIIFKKKKSIGIKNVIKNFFFWLYVALFDNAVHQEFLVKLALLYFDTSWHLVFKLFLFSLFSTIFV